MAALPEGRLLPQAARGRVDFPLSGTHNSNILAFLELLTPDLSILLKGDERAGVFPVMRFRSGYRWDE